MSRHPYTHSADYIRFLAGYREDGGGTKLSRADAARISEGLATALGISKEDLCTKLSLYFQANQDRFAKEGAARFLATQGDKDF